MPSRRATAIVFLCVLAVGVLWPALAGVVRCGDCCHARSHTCGIPATGFSLCCFHSASTLPAVPLPTFVLAAGSCVHLADEEGGPPPAPRGILHVPKPVLT